jgi:hypothetical protein
MIPIHRYFVRMIVFMGGIGALVWVLKQSLIKAFQNNIPLNTTILITLSLGIGLVFYRIYHLGQEQKWFESYQRGEERFPGVPTPRILYPLSVSLSNGLLGERNQQNQTLSPINLRSILSSVETRLDEVRDVTRYLIGLLIFLGLLGTFWGLSQTIGAIAGVITGLDMGAENVKDTFQNLKQGLQSPLVGMGTAFSTSMFGLASSLILGFLDLQAGKAAGSFYHNLEDHLSQLTKASWEVPAIPAPVHSGPAYLHSLLEQTAEGMSQLKVILHRHEENRSNILNSLQLVGEKMAMLTEQMISQQALLKKMAQGQVDLQKYLEQFAALAATPSFQGGDDGVKQYLRNLDTTTLRLLEELIEGRNQGVQELKEEIRLVAKTISALANQELT